MINKLKAQKRFKISALLIFMSFFCLSLSLIRFLITDSRVFLFLNWNLFLAFIPWLVSSLIIINGLQTRKLLMAILLLTWIVFFPNSPYILTDLYHLKVRNSAPIWYDLIVVLSFAWTGLIYGFVSLMDIEQILRTFFHTRWFVSLIIVFFLFLSSFGVYLGRYLRWNSWDIISNPFGLFGDIFDHLVKPFDYLGAWGMTFLLGILLNMMYYSLKLINCNE